MGLLPTRKGKRIFISWVKHSTRSASFAQALDVDCYFCNDGQRFGPLKYVPRTLHMIWILIATRPSTVLCMNPPTFVGLIAYCYTLLFRAKFALDSHTGAFDDIIWEKFTPLHAFLVKRAALSTVTNTELARRVEEMGGISVVLTDIPYTMQQGSYTVQTDRFTICFVCSYSRDEPILEIFKAARQSSDVLFYMTGDDKKANNEILNAKPDNVIMTGYLSNDEYVGLIRGVSAMMALTTGDFTMQRAGSEAITIGKPLITSDWPLLRETFSQGTVHVENNAEAIVEGIQRLRDQLEQYEREIVELRQQRETRWDKVREQIDEILK